MLMKVDDEDYKWLSKFKWGPHKGYAVRVVKDKETNKWLTILCHRLIMNPDKEKVVHHINLDRLDNRKKNLEILSNAEHLRLHAKLHALKHDATKKGLQLLNNANS